MPHKDPIKRRAYGVIKTREWRERNPGYDWKAVRYKLTSQERLELFESSDGLCALCYEQPAKVIDHDHETGAVRGALCHQCNTGLGWIEKMGASSDAIVEYLTTDWRAA
jgi:hypothetical protein